MVEIQIKKQGFNGHTDALGKSLYDVELEGNIHLRSFDGEFLKEDGKEYSITGIIGKLGEPGYKEKQYRMTIENHKVGKVVPEISWFSV
jgi:hypothetical protein